MSDVGGVGLDPAGERLDARERICEATRDLVVELGYGIPTVGMVAARARVSEAEFYRHFGDIEACCLQVYRRNIADLNQVVFDNFEVSGPWRDRLRATGYALARFLRGRAKDVRFDIVEMTKAGAVPRMHRERQLQRLVDVIDEGRQELDDPDSMTRATAEGVVGAIYSLVMGEVQAGRATAAAPESVVPDIMYVALRPYLGHQVAMEELTIPAPPEESKGG